MNRAPLTVEEQRRRAAALAATSPVIQSAGQDDDERDLALDDHELLPKERTPEQQKNYRILNGDGGFSSWERVLSPSYSAGLEFELKGVAQSVELA